MTQRPKQNIPVGRGLMTSLLEGFMWLDRGLQQNLQAQGLPSVRRLESMVLVYVASGIQRPSDLARTLGVTRQSINSAVRELEEKRLIELAPDPADKRCKLIRFSREGRPVHLAAATIMSNLEAALTDRLGEQTIDALLKGLGDDWGDVPTVSADAKQEAS
eukprot:s1_g1199.t1